MESVQEPAMIVVAAEALETKLSFIDGVLNVRRASG